MTRHRFDIDVKEIYSLGKERLVAIVSVKEGEFYEEVGRFRVEMGEGKTSYDPEPPYTVLPPVSNEQWQNFGKIIRAYLDGYVKNYGPFVWL